MNPITISLAELEAIIAVMQEGSFRVAAEALQISQPAVSARVRHAEDILGVKLFHRTTRRVVVTEFGKQLATRAERTLTDLRALVHDFKDEARLKKGLVVVGATPAVAATGLTSALQEFMRRWRGVEVALRDDFFGRSHERLITGEVDFAVTPARQSNPSINFERLYLEEVVIVAPDNHPLVSRSVAEVREVANYPLLLMAPQSSMWNTISELFATNDLPFRPTFLTLHQLTLLSMVKAGLGVTFLPVLSLKLLNMEGLRIARAGRGGIFREIGLATAHGRSIQPAAKALMKLLCSKYRQDATRIAPKFESELIDPKDRS